jgi:Arc/MetJ family transcription regulator
MHTNMTIDDKLLQRAMKPTGLSTKLAVVEEGPRLLIKVRGQGNIRHHRGKIVFEGNASDADAGEQLL